MSDIKLKEVSNLLFHAMMLIQTSAGVNIVKCDVDLGNYDVHIDFDEGEVTVCEAKTSFNLERQ